MHLRRHFRLLAIVTVVWALFWLAGLPDYYRQYSTKSMIVFVILILPPLWFVVYLSAKRARRGLGLRVSLWLSFYIAVPLFIYDILYCAFYLGHGVSFLWKYWYLTIYYVIPWVFFPLTGWLVDASRRETSTNREATMK